MSSSRQKSGSIATNDWAASSRPERNFGVTPPREVEPGKAAKETLATTTSTTSRSATTMEPRVASARLVASSPARPRHHEVLHKATSAPKLERPSDATGLLPLAAMKARPDPAEQEQILFEQRLCEDTLGVAVRKINQYGKANLRYVKCVSLEEYNNNNHHSGRSISSRSERSWGRRRASSRENVRPNAGRALVWGKKKDVQIPLSAFVSVRKGKTTERAKRNPSPGTRVLSLMTKDPRHPSLDIEAPTRMDRDKFARAFARFLEVPLETESVSDDVTPATLKTTPDPSAEEGDFAGKTPPRASVPVTRDCSNNSDYPSSVNVDGSSRPTAESSQEDEDDGPEAIVELKPADPAPAADEGSVVSSLTGHAYDQELVEELHQALTDLRAELEESRAEAARAVKVAEQAIQSAERSSSAEWQNTVTHKAAEAAALAQKKSAEAMAKQRLAEERLESERRTAAFWRKQAEIAESEAGQLQTRAAAAEVQRAAFEEKMDSERRLAAAQMAALTARLESLTSQRQATLDATLERNRALEMEVETLRRELQARQGEDEENEKSGKRKLKFGGWKKASAEDKALLLANGSNAEQQQHARRAMPSEVTRLQVEMEALRKQYELLRQTTQSELESLPVEAKAWSQQVSQTLEASQGEIARLRERLAIESASRRKLLHQVQDLRGIVRVYCRPKASATADRTIATPSQETLVLHREKYSNDGAGPMSFEFDRIFDEDASQHDVFTEIQDVLLGVMDGYNVCLMAYGQTGAGKTKTLLGDVTTHNGEMAIENHGLHLQVMKQLLSIAKHRSERFKDTFTITIVEVHNERISDLLAGTQAAANKGQLVVAETKRKKAGDDDASSARPAAKLEIRTDIHGETVVQGALSLEIESFEETLQVWEEALANRRNRLVEQEVDVAEYESSAHVIATVHITSANIATGHGTVGRLQFVDLAGADLVQKKDAKEIGSLSRGVNNEVKFVHRSLETLDEVAVARSQFVRTVPYRNSTLTHLIRDSLEADTKVLLFACISTDARDLSETAQTLRFAHRMRQVNLGKATKHTITSP